MPKVSVIIPVYKVEQYLPACLDSVSNQTFQDFELILVDDGSPDTCGAMCDAYAQEHPNTKVIHQQNMGLSEARNQGVKIATGEYVTFIDSDDYVSADYLAYLVYLTEKYDAEVSVSEKVSFWDDKQPQVRSREEKDCQLDTVPALIQICYNKVPICAWGKLYKRYLVEKYPYPKGELYEDTATTYKIVGAVKSIAYGTRQTYFWRQRGGSITHAKIDERHMFGITAGKEQISYMEKYYPEAVAAAKVRCVMKIIDISYRLVMSKTRDDLFRKTRRELKPLLSAVLRNKKAGLSLKVRAVALYMGRIPYFVISKLYTVVKPDIISN